MSAVVASSYFCLSWHSAIFSSTSGLVGMGTSSGEFAGAPGSIADGPDPGTPRVVSDGLRRRLRDRVRRQVIDDPQAGEADGDHDQARAARLAQPRVVLQALDDVCRLRVEDLIELRRRERRRVRVVEL